MKAFLKRKYLMIALILLLTSGSNTLYAHGFTFGGLDYTNTQGEVVSFGGNLWKDNYSKGTAIFPLSEAWTPVSVGQAEGQPLIIDGIIFSIGGKNLTAIKKETGEILRTASVQTMHPNFNPGSLFVIKHSYTSYQLISPSKDGRIVSITANVVRNGDQSVVGLNFSPHWQFNVTQLSRHGLDTAQLLTQSVTILRDANPGINKVYAGFGTYTGHMVVLDSATGTPIVNGAIEFDSVLGSSGGIVYRNFADILLPRNAKSVGGFVGGTVHNGVLSLNLSVKDNVHSEGVIGPMAYAVINNASAGSTSGMLIAQDKNGRLIGYNTTQQQLFFVIDKYEGAGSINSIAIAGKYILATFAEDKNGKAKVACINYEAAIEAAQYDPDKLANSSILFEEIFDAHTYSGAVALSVAEQEFDSFGNIKEVIFREVFLAANRSTNASAKNLQMFYLDQYNAATKKPLAVPYAFQKEESPGVYKTSSGIHIAGGINSQLSYGGGYLVFADGKGFLHAYTAAKENNLALVNLENTSTLLERGKSYTAVVDVANFTGELQEDVPIEFLINDEKIHEDIISFGAEGITVNFKYTLPFNYDKDNLKLEARLNMKTPRGLDETTYDDNIATLMMDVAKVEELDLEVARITHSSFFRGQYGIVNVHVKNNSNKTVSNPAVPVRLQIAGTTVQMTESINLAPNKSTTVSFRVSVPDVLMSFTMIGEVNHTRVYTETSYANNSKQATANIVSPSLVAGCASPSTTWTEYRGVGQYSTGSIVDRHYVEQFSHYIYYEEQIGAEPDGTPIMREYSEAVYVTVLVGYTVRFNAQLNTTVNITPRTIKAGYGIEVSASTSVITNYDKPYRLTNAQNIFVSFPDRSTPVMLVPQGSTSSLGAITWILPSNTQSVFRERKHYIPVQWPDGLYNIRLSVQDAVTPNDTLCRTTEDAVSIFGQMYEDDHTGIGR